MAPTTRHDTRLENRQIKVFLKRDNIVYRGRCLFENITGLILEEQKLGIIFVPWQSVWEVHNEKYS